MVECKAGVLSSNRKRRYRRVELKYSLSKPELERGTSLQSGSLVPSDCHWAVFLDDTVERIRIIALVLVLICCFSGQGVVGERKSVSPGGRFS
jgi:hypothetical protein